MKKINVGKNNSEHKWYNAINSWLGIVGALNISVSSPKGACITRVDLRLYIV